MRLVLLAIFVFCFSLNSFSREQRVIKSPDFEEHWWNSFSLVSSWTELFKINSTLFLWGQGDQCHVLYCSNLNDCNHIEANLCSTSPAGFYLNTASFLSFKKDPGSCQEYSDKWSREEIIGNGEGERNVDHIYLDFRATFDEKVKPIKYLLNHKEKLNMSKWLTSLNCKSDNYLKILLDKKIAQTIMKGKFSKKNNLLILETSSDSIFKGRSITVEDSLGEMAYVYSGMMNHAFTLYSSKKLTGNEASIPALNFCENYYDLEDN